jgi:hypothetical protein
MFTHANTSRTLTLASAFNSYFWVCVPLSDREVCHHGSLRRCCSVTSGEAFNSEGRSPSSPLRLALCLMRLVYFWRLAVQGHSFLVSVGVKRLLEVPDPHQCLLSWKDLLVYFYSNLLCFTLLALDLLYLSRK